MLAFCCTLFCILIFYGGLIAGYWALLFKVSWAHGMAIISIIYFGFTILFDSINGILYAVALCCTAHPITTIYVFVVWAIFYGVGIWGLVASVQLLTSDSMQCPTDGATCTLLVILFGISLFSISFSTYKRAGYKTMSQ